MQVGITQTRPMSRLFSAFESDRKRREALAGYLFTLPVILGFLTWVAGPMIATLGISFTNWPVIGQAQWIGLQNYTNLFTTDPFFLSSVKATAYFAFGSVFLRIIYSFLIAALLNQEIRGKAIFRTIYYLPVIVPVIASSMIWTWAYSVDFGLFNSILKIVGLPTLGWINDSSTVIPSLILMDLWASGSTIVIFLAGLQGVPRELKEAVEVDGGNWWHKFWAVTFPHMTPFILFNGVLGFIGAFQIFAQSYVMTGGGPENASLFLVLLIYRQAFQNNNMGLACAIAWMLFMMIAAVTFVIFRTSGTWVFYYGEEK
jgi:multiple sugar transport system permease protein